MNSEKNKIRLSITIKIITIIIFLCGISGLFCCSYESFGILLNNKINSLNENWLSAFYYGSFCLICCISFFIIKFIKSIIQDKKKLKESVNINKHEKGHILFKNKAYLIASITILITLLITLIYFNTIFLKDIVTNKIDVFDNYLNLVLFFVLMTIIVTIVFMIIYMIINELKKLSNDSKYTFNNSGFVVINIIVLFVIGTIINIISLKMYNKCYPEMYGDYNVNENSSLIAYILLTILSTVVFSFIGYLVYRFILNMIKINNEELNNK
jgi:MFS family permease